MTDRRHIVCFPGGWTIELIESFQPNSNFLREDYVSMFTSLGTDLVMGHMNQSSEAAMPFYLLDKPSGSRIMVYPPGTYKAVSEEKEEDSWQSSINPEPIV